MKRLLLALALVGLNAVLGAGALPDETCDVLVAEPTPADGLVVTAVRPTGERVTVRFDEGRIAVKGTGLSAEYARAFREKMSIGANALGFDFSGYRYRVPVTGELTATQRGYRLTGDEIVLDLAGATADSRLPTEELTTFDSRQSSVAAAVVCPLSSVAPFH